MAVRPPLPPLRALSALLKVSVLPAPRGCSQGRIPSCVSEVTELKLHGLVRYSRQFTNILDVVIVIFQLTTNVLFWLRDDKMISEAGIGGRPIGVLLSMHACSVLFLFLRLLAFFQGVPRLGSLIHSLYRIFFEIAPFLCVTIVVTLGFSAAFAILFTQLGIYGFSSFRMSVYTTLNSKHLVWLSKRLHACVGGCMLLRLAMSPLISYAD